MPLVRRRGSENPGPSFYSLESLKRVIRIHFSKSLRLRHSSGCGSEYLSIFAQISFISFCKRLSLMATIVAKYPGKLFPFSVLDLTFISIPSFMDDLHAILGKFHLRNVRCLVDEITLLKGVGVCVTLKDGKLRGMWFLVTFAWAS